MQPFFIFNSLCLEYGCAQSFVVADSVYALYLKNIFPVAQPVSRGAIQVLRVGAQGASDPHAAVPRLVGQGQLRKVEEAEEEEDAGQGAGRHGR